MRVEAAAAACTSTDTTTCSLLPFTVLASVPGMKAVPAASVGTLTIIHT